VASIFLERRSLDEGKCEHKCAIEHEGAALFDVLGQHVERALRTAHKLLAHGGEVLVRVQREIAHAQVDENVDGTVGELFSHTNISPYRPAHIHFMIESPGFHKVTTHLFQKGDQYIETDVVYGVKEPLIVEFQKKGAGEKAPNGEVMKKPFYVVNYDFTLQKLAQAKAA